MMKQLFYSLVTAIALCTATSCLAKMQTLDHYTAYAANSEEYPDIDNDNWLNPDYSSFHKAHMQGWISTIAHFFGFSSTPVWSAQEFATLLGQLTNQRETNGYIGRFVQKLAPETGTKIIVISDLYGSFHSLLRDLTALRGMGIIDKTFTIKSGYYLVFASNAIDFSPYNLETLTVIMRLMITNPTNVIYIRGKHEDKEHWKNFDLKRELNLRAPHVSDKQIQRFFDTLPLALYFTSPEGKNSSVVRLSCFGRDHQELNEDNFADFFLLENPEKTNIRNLDQKTKADQAIDIKAIIKSEDRLTKYSATEGLIQTDSDKGSTAWFVTSSPNRTFRSLYKFFFDAFAVIKTDGTIDHWTISLYNQDVREQLGIKKRQEYNLTSGDEITLETKEIKTLRKQAKELQDELAQCRAQKKVSVPTTEPSKKEQELVQKEAALAKKEAELAQKATELTKPAEQEQQEIIIGTTLGLTGNVKEESESVQLGLQLRIDQENKAGGINGKKIKLIVLDDGYQPAKARKNVLDLIEKHKADIVLFPVGTATTLEYLDLVKDKKIIVLFTSSGSPALRNPTPEYLIHFRPSYISMADALISYANKTLSAKKFAILSQSDATAEGIIESIKAAGIAPDNYIEVTHQRNITDMSKQAEQIKKFKPDALILWTTSSAAMAIIKEIGAENLINTKMLGADLRNTRFNAFLDSVGLNADYIDAQALPNVETSKLPIMTEYRTEMGSRPVDGMSAEAYVGANILIYLLHLTGGKTNKSEIIKRIENIKNLDLGGITLSFDQSERRLSNFIWLSTGKEWTAVNVKAIEQTKEQQSLATQEQTKKQQKEITERQEAEKKATQEKKQKEEKLAQQKIATEQTTQPSVLEEEEEFVIGSTLDLSKSLREEGQKMREGLNAYIRMVNREGGVRGKKVKLVVLDDAYDPVIAKKNVETLINTYKTNIILSSLGSPTTAGYLDLIKEKKVLVVFPFTGSPVLRDPSYSNILHLTPPYDQIELALFRYGIDKLEVKKWSLFAQSDEMTAGVKQILQVAGVTDDASTFLGYERNVTDFSKQVKQYEEFKPDAIALFSTSRAATEFLRQVGVDKLVNKKLMGIQLGDVNFKEFIKQQGLEKQFFDIQTVPNPESNLAVLQEYRKEMGSADAYSAVAYIAAAIFFDILKRVEGPLTNENIIATAEKTKNYNLGGLLLNFTPSSRTILNYIWLDTGKPGDWEQVEVKPGDLSVKK
jgi:branched-chain amino acid transport system substrate-binding protein